MVLLGGSFLRAIVVLVGHSEEPKRPIIKHSYS